MNRTKYLKGECRECGGHIEFPAEAAGTTIDCPHCGKPTDLLLAAPPTEPTVSRKAIAWTIIAVIILGLGLAASLAALKRAQNWAARQKEKSAATLRADTATNTQTAPTPEEAAARMGLKIGAIHLEKTPGSTLIYAVGTVSNMEKKQRFGVKLELDLFDNAGRKVGTATDYQQLLESRGKWNFKALVVDSKTANAKLASIKEEQ